MIISHKHKYLFVELPRTASTAISRELRELYDGQAILRKHATYYDFLKIATPEEKQYFVFAGIRNPLDDAVSLYFKYKTDHRQQFAGLAENQRKKRRLAEHVAAIKFRFIKETEADFSTYFKRFYKIPYNTWSDLSHKQFDYVIRFENLQNDFASVLALIGIEPQRPLPALNKTGGKDRDFLSYYTPEIIPRAKHVFGPYMKRWGYAFPPDWGDDSVSWWQASQFEFFNLFRNVYWRYVRFRF
jgi:hypothetical protein